MSRAVRVHEIGGPEVLRLEEVTVGEPGPGEARVRHTAIGVNFIDTYFRSGLYPAPATPFIPGAEAAGVVEAVGPGVTAVKPGDRVGYVVTLGAYADERLIAADRLVRIPDDISDRDAAAMLLKGMTVRFLLRATYPVRPETKMLVHAAAGGVGLLMGQWARHLGVGTIIGTVGSPEKAALAAANGYTHVIDYRAEDFVSRVRDITGGRGVDVAYDSVGKDTFPGSLDCLRPRGLWVSFGNASGPRVRTARDGPGPLRRGALRCGLGLGAAGDAAFRCGGGAPGPRGPADFGGDGPDPLNPRFSQLRHVCVAPAPLRRSTMGHLADGGVPCPASPHCPSPNSSGCSSRLRRTCPPLPTSST
jgi:NADPH2:quinone reductase